MGLFVDTVSADVTLKTLGVTLIHPTTNYDLGGQFSAEELQKADDLTSAITTGTLAWKKTSGGTILIGSDYDPDVKEIDDMNTGTGATADRVVTFKDLNIGVTHAPTGFINQTDSKLSFVNGTRTFTIGVNSPATSFIYYFEGIAFTKTGADSVVIPNTEGLHYIYYSTTNVLTRSATYISHASGLGVICAILYWDLVNQVLLALYDERHGLSMDYSTHEYLHNTVGAQIIKGGFAFGNYNALGDGSLASHAELSVSNGILYDEDMRCPITNAATPANRMEQILSPIAKIPIFYKLGVVASQTVEETAAGLFPLVWTAGSRISYNLLSGGSWSLAQATEGYIVTIFIYASTDYNHPIIGVLGQRQDTDVVSADQNNKESLLDFTGIPKVEFYLLGRLFFKTSSAYTNQPKARLEAISEVQNNLNTAQGLTNFILESSTAFSTASATDVVITGFQITPSAGTYAVWYSSDAVNTQNNATIGCALYVNGTLHASSTRLAQSVSANFVFGQYTQDIIQFNGATAIDVRVKTSQGTLTVNSRSIILMRLGG